MGEICSVTLDTEGSKAGDGVSCKPSVSSEIIDNSTEHQKEPNQNQLNRKPQSSPAGVDEFPETERQVADADPPDETRQGCNEEKEKAVEEDIFKGSQEIPGDSQVDMVEEREEQDVLHKSSSELGDPPGRRRADMKSLELSSAADGERTCGPVPEAGVDEEDNEQTKDDVGAETHSPEEAKLRDEDTKEDNADQSCPAEPNSEFTVSKHPESLISRKKDHVWKRECRSFRNLKVLQTAACRCADESSHSRKCLVGSVWVYPPKCCFSIP